MELMESSNNIIYSFESRDNFLYKSMKDLFKMNNKELQEEIIREFKDFNTKLSEAGLEYSDFKNTLVPSKNIKDCILVFDTKKIQDAWYGFKIFEKIIPCFEEDTNHNVLEGDLLDFSNGKNVESIVSLMCEQLGVEKIFENQYTNRFYLVYINNIKNTELEELRNAFLNEDYFVGLCDMSYSSIFKSYISCSISTRFVKIKDTIIMGHEDDIEDNANDNICGYPFEKYDYKVLSINRNIF